MTVADLIQSLRFYCQDLRNHVAPEAVAREREREALCLRHRLCRSYRDLLRQRNAIASKRSRIAADERRVAALTSRVEASLQAKLREDAYRAAMDLDLVRNNLDAQRQQACQLEEEYRTHVEHIRRLEQRRDEIESRYAAGILRPASLDS